MTEVSEALAKGGMKSKGKLPALEATANAIPRRDGGKAGGIGFLDTALNVFVGQCSGLVDAASLVLHSCHDEGTRPSTGLSRRNTTRRQGETLEFPAQDGFEDDVSALSAHTLEEMEKRTSKVFRKQGSTRKALVGSTKQPYPGQVLEPPPPPPPTTSSNRKELDWTYRVQRPSSFTDMSLGVSTSGSASSSESKHRHRDGTNVEDLEA